MKYKVYSKILLDTRTLDFEGLKKVANAYDIKAKIDSNQAYYQDDLYFIYRANLEGKDLEDVLRHCKGSDDHSYLMLNCRQKRLKR